MTVLGTQMLCSFAICLAVIGFLMPCSITIWYLCGCCIMRHIWTFVKLHVWVRACVHRCASLGVILCMHTCLCRCASVSVFWQVCGYLWVHVHESTVLASMCESGSVYIWQKHWKIRMCPWDYFRKYCELLMFCALLMYSLKRQGGLGVWRWGRETNILYIYI